MSSAYVNTGALGRSFASGAGRWPLSGRCTSTCVPTSLALAAGWWTSQPISACAAVLRGLDLAGRAESVPARTAGRAAGLGRRKPAGCLARSCFFWRHVRARHAILAGSLAAGGAWSALVLGGEARPGAFAAQVRKEERSSLQRGRRPAQGSWAKCPLPPSGGAAHHRHLLSPLPFPPPAANLQRRPVLGWQRLPSVPRWHLHGPRGPQRARLLPLPASGAPPASRAACSTQVHDQTRSQLHADPLYTTMPPAAGRDPSPAATSFTTRRCASCATRCGGSRPAPSMHGVPSSPPPARCLWTSARLRPAPPAAQGTYQPDRRQAECRVCPDGKYQDELGRATCKICG